MIDCNNLKPRLNIAQPSSFDIPSTLISLILSAIFNTQKNSIQMTSTPRLITNCMTASLFADMLLLGACSEGTTVQAPDLNAAAPETSVAIADDKPLVVTTVAPITNIVSNIAGDRTRPIRKSGRS